jgi:hypothetical protein
MIKIEVLFNITNKIVTYIDLLKLLVKIYRGEGFEPIITGEN